MSNSGPYLSIVVTSRNDDHGGGMLRRMQTFVNALASQCQRHKLDAELVFVEWNPPADRPLLAQAICWPQPLGPLSVRILEVPASVHNTFERADGLPLFQMIGKNAGIRRARAPFVLSSNVDLLFNDELMSFLAARQLKTDRVYRIDRTDTGPDVPVDATIDEQLAYCQSHLLRVNAKEGVFPLGAEGWRLPLANDIVTAETGIHLEDGWYPPEQDESGRFRWASSRSVVVMPDGSKEGSHLSLEVEPGPAMGYGPFDLTVSIDGHNRLQRFRIERRQTIAVSLPAGVDRPATLEFTARGSGSRRIANEFRQLAMRVFGIELVDGAAAQTVAAQGAPSFGWLQALARRAKVWVRASDRATTTEQSSTSQEVPVPAEIHIGAAGDFTLMSKESWLRTGGHAEFTTYSMHIDTLMCYQAHYSGTREEVLPAPMRLYHIEHGNGSGWTPEGQAELFRRMAERGVPVIRGEQLMAWATEMARTEKPLTFNSANWGLADLELRETVIPAAIRVNRAA